MAWQPPTEWDQYIGGFGSPLAPPMDLSVPPMLEQFALPGEIAKHGDVSAPPPPPPPPPQTIGAMGAPVQDEVPLSAVPQEQPPLLDTPEQLQTPPMLGHVDAISGGYTPEQIAQAQGTIDVHGEDTRPLLGEPMAGDDLGNFLSTLPVEQQEEFRRKTEEGRQKVADAGKLEADTKRLRDAEDSARIYQDSVRDAQERAKQLDLEAKQISEENPLDSISGGRKIMGVLASIVGGFMANKTGRNMGLEAVDQIANEAMQLHAQKLQLNARQQAGIGDQIARARDVSKASEAVRLAVYDGAIRQLETQVQNFDPRGTTALRVMDDVNALKQRRADALQKYLQGEQKRLEDQRKYELDAMKAQGQYAKDMADVQKTQLEAQKLAGQIGGAGKTKVIKFEDQPMTLDQLRGFGVQIPDGVTEPPGGLSINQAKKLAEAGKSAQEWNKAALDSESRNIGGLPSVELDKDGNPKTNFAGNPVIKYEDLKNDDGKPFKAPSDPEAIELRKKTAAVNTIQTLMGQTIMLRNKYGWSSDLLKSPEWRKMKANWSTILVKQKDLQALGAISSSDLQLIEGLMGTNDPSEYLDPQEGMIQAFDNTELQYNTDLRSLRYTGKDIRFARPWEGREAQKTPEQKSVEEITAFDPKRSMSAQDLQSLGVDPKSVRAQGGRLNTEIASALEKQGGVPPRIKQQIDALRDMAGRDPDQKKRDFAVQSLKNIAEGALDPNVKAYAQSNAFNPADVAAPNLSKEEAR